MHSVTKIVWILAAVIGAPYLFYALQVGRRKKDHIRFKLRRIVVCMLAYLLGIFVLTKLGYKPYEAALFSFLLGIAAGFLFVRSPYRTRVIPKHIKQAVIKRDLKGVDFDPKLHHIDHIVPYSRGGDNSKANLRVMSNTENLRKGSRMPRWKEMI
jgi:HNH endonuclease